MPHLLQGGWRDDKPIGETLDYSPGKVLAIEGETPCGSSFSQSPLRDANIYINPMGGDELKAMVDRIAGPSKKGAVTLLREAIELKGATRTEPQ